ncbi:hypothetical protein [Enterovibrio norvegicus]|uniref:hypothetical protein n=1 Tax=Enterovibrio norvegicus TaxID=188144 RepID=UPI0018E450E3|nr:hypothetical protein [Enterovibrio norvegicus]
MLKYIVFALVGFGVFIGVRFSDDITRYISEDDIEAISEQVIDTAIEKLEDLRG